MKHKPRRITYAMLLPTLEKIERIYRARRRGEPVNEEVTLEEAELLQRSADYARIEICGHGIGKLPPQEVVDFYKHETQTTAP